MRENTRQMKEAKGYLLGAIGTERLMSQMIGVIEEGKKSFDRCLMDLGVMFAQALMYVEREEISGPEYAPKEQGLYKWASQPGSIYIAGSKVRVARPRLRRADQEVSLKSYSALRDPKQFNEEVLAKVLRGISERKYAQALEQYSEQFGVSPSSVSGHVIKATQAKLKEFLEEDLGGFDTFAIFLDTVHRGGLAFIVALGLDRKGVKKVLGFWEGATENAEICQALLTDLESRGLVLGSEVLYISDGGKGIKKALKERFGFKLLHQRCTIHKDRNIQLHLPKRYRKEAHRRFRNALDLTTYEEAKQELEQFEKWLRSINESAADSLLEAFEELLTLHKLGIPPKFRKTLHSTNPIESLFSQVRDVEHNIKRYRNSRMTQRWLATSLMYAQSCFRRVKGYEFIAEITQGIKSHQLPLQKVA